MKGAMVSLRAASIHKQVLSESERIIDAFARMPSTKHRATIKVARHIILNSPYILNGRTHEVKSKSLGAGVYELSCELKGD